jgi:hypothetical protein
MLPEQRRRNLAPSGTGGCQGPCDLAERPQRPGSGHHSLRLRRRCLLTVDPGPPSAGLPVRRMRRTLLLTQSGVFGRLKPLA